MEGQWPLYSSTVGFACDSSVYFYNNTAMEAGGAIYVDKNYKNVPPVHSMYLWPCFYRLLRVTTYDWHNITIFNNSAAKGGSDIYGEFMHSGICDAGDGTSGYTVTVPSCLVQTRFHYHRKTASSVSSDPVRVCMCKSGHQLCNESYGDIIVYPGETFALSLLLLLELILVQQ